MAATWAYSDWIRSSLYPIGSAARLDRLELHIQEVSDKISAGSFSVEGKSHDFDLLQKYLTELRAAQKEEVAAGAASAGTETTFVQIRPIRPGGGMP